jgi:hypothetical protein
MIEHDETVGSLLKLSMIWGSPTTRSLSTALTTAAYEYLAGRRDDSVPLGEEHKLGRRLPRADARSLAGTSSQAR